ncbi:chemerin-like receptor 1 [Dendropsophus ebraccatus]|uniref:chemerin-like receptor 1 n=1 Tax=Dendropsophus ebraccatus TaxID=150705 RepID=UPI0038313987
MALSHDLCYSILDIHLLLEFRDSYSSVLQYFSFVMSIVICLVGLVGNAVVIWLLGFIMKKYKSRYWFLNLAIADFFFLLTLPFYAISTLKGTWTFGTHMCKLYLFTLFINIYSSVYILITLNIARVLSVATPMFHLKFISQRVSFQICTLIWFISIFSSLPVFYYSSDVNIGEVTQCSYLYSKNLSTAIVNDGYNVSGGNATRGISVGDICTKLSPFIDHCSTDTCCGGEQAIDSWNHMMLKSQWISMPFLTFGYFIPLGVVIICNITIAAHIRKSKTPNPYRLYRITLVIIMVFFIAWTPTFIGEIIFLIAVNNRDIVTMDNVLTVMPLVESFAYANSCLNPIVYVMTGGRMRTGLSNIIRNIRNNYT